MNISEVRIRKVEKDDSKLKAVASVTIDNCFVVHDIKIIQGEIICLLLCQAKRQKKASTKTLLIRSIRKHDRNCQTPYLKLLKNKTKTE